MKKLLFLLVFALSLNLQAEKSTVWTAPQSDPQTASPCGALYVLPASPDFEPLTLHLPNTSPFNQPGGPRLVIVKLGPAGQVTWLGMSCDSVSLPPASEIRVVAHDPYYKHLEQWLFTVLPSGYLEYRFSPL